MNNAALRNLQDYDSNNSKTKHQDIALLLIRSVIYISFLVRLIF